MAQVYSREEWSWHEVVSARAGKHPARKSTPFLFGSRQSARGEFLTGPGRPHTLAAMSASLFWKSPVGARLLVVALAVLSLGAPWLAGKGDCREPGCITESAPGLMPEVFAPPGTPPCPCPSFCETEPSRGCAQTCDRVRESIFGRQPQRIRQGAVEPRSLAFAADVGPDAVLAAGSLRWTADGPSVTPSAPLFIRHKSIIR